jgi:hypothetical protein
MSENELDKEFIEPGQWNDDQKEFIKNILLEIDAALRNRFPSISQNMKIEHIFPKEGIATKIKVNYFISEDIHLGELDCRQHLNAFRDYPEESRTMLASMINNHTVSIYERVITKALSEQLNNLIHQNEKYAYLDDGKIIIKSKKIIQSLSIPEDVILMHPNTFQAAKGLMESQ